MSRFDRLPPSCALALLFVAACGDDPPPDLVYEPLWSAAGVAECWRFDAVTGDFDGDGITEGFVDVDGDGAADLLVREWTEISIYYWAGGLVQTPIATGDGVRQAGDIDGDGSVEIAVRTVEGGGPTRRPFQSPSRGTRSPHAHPTLIPGSAGAHVCPTTT